MKKIENYFGEVAPLDSWGKWFMFFLTAWTFITVYFGVYKNLSKDIVGGFEVFVSLFWLFFAIVIIALPATYVFYWVRSNAFWDVGWWVDQNKKNKFLKEAVKIDWYTASHEHQSFNLQNAIPTSLSQYRHKYFRSGVPNQYGFVFGYELINKKTGGVAYRRFNVCEDYRLANCYHEIYPNHID